MTNRALFGSTAEHEGAISVNSAGLAIGSLLGGVHLLWALFVASGLAQPIMDFVFWLHFIRSGWQIESFDLARAAGLIVMTSAIGYATGAIFALFWNRFQRS
jgi:hypothetical protein